jgi:hypothetical protein
MTIKIQLKKSLVLCLKGISAKMNWLTVNRQSYSNFDIDFEENQSRRGLAGWESVEIREFVVNSWETNPSEVVAGGRPWWRRGRRRSPHCCKSLRSNDESNCVLGKDRSRGARKLRELRRG